MRVFFRPPALRQTDTPRDQMKFPRVATFEELPPFQLDKTDFKIRTISPNPKELIWYAERYVIDTAPLQFFVKRNVIERQRAKKWIAGYVIFVKHWQPPLFSRLIRYQPMLGI